MNQKTYREHMEQVAPERVRWLRRGRYYHRYLESLVAFLVPTGKSVLQVGCESSSLLARLVPNKGLGINDSSRMVSELEKEPHSKHIEFRAAQIPEIKEEFEYIIMLDVVGYAKDVEQLFRDAANRIDSHGRVVVTQYSVLWEPVLYFATILGLRMRTVRQNWISRGDLENMARLAGLEVVKSGTKVLVPLYIPFISALFNKILANIWPLSRLGLVQYVVARKQCRADEIDPSLSIVVPARNEAGTIERIIQELPELGAFTELIFVEGNSRDNTYAEIERAAKKFGKERRIKYAKQAGKGKGDAVRKGFDLAEGDILTVYDADMTVPPEDIAKFYRAITENRGDFINGSRLVYPMEKQSMRLLNYFGNKFFSLAFSWVLGQRLKDTLCGTKMLWRTDYEDIKQNRAFFGDFDPFGDFDLLFGAAKLNRRIIDMPVRYRERIYGETNISRWRHGFLLLKMTIFAARKLKFR